jgi:hypothetical protein
MKLRQIMLAVLVVASSVSEAGTIYSNGVEVGMLTGDNAQLLSRFQLSGETVGMGYRMLEDGRFVNLLTGVSSNSLFLSGNPRHSGGDWVDIGAGARSGSLATGPDGGASPATPSIVPDQLGKSLPAAPDAGGHIPAQAVDMGVTPHQEIGVASHQDNGIASHQDKRLASQQANGLPSHDEYVRASHDENGLALHQENGSTISHEGNQTETGFVIQHDNAESTWQTVLAPDGGGKFPLASNSEGDENDGAVRLDKVSLDTGGTTQESNLQLLANEVPEPSTGLTVFVGFALAGWLGRRQTRMQGGRLAS